ncbi:MAG: TnpV protein [Clostridia bacterium]|nr:TnpV protein [Clostridia bacterium]
MKLPEQTNYQIGKYGQFYLDYIKNHRRGRYTTLLTEGKLNARLHEIDFEANKMLDTIIPRLAAERGIDENLKARDMLRWVAEMNNIKVSAEEIVLREVVLV